MDKTMGKEQFYLVETLYSLSKILYFNEVLSDIEIIFLTEKEYNYKESCLSKIKSIDLRTIVETGTAIYLCMEDYLCSVSKGITEKDELFRSKMAIVVTLE